MTSLKHEAPQIAVTDFSEKMIEKTVYFKIMTMEQSFYVWIGLEPVLANLSMAMPPRYDGTPSVTTLLGTKSDEMATSLSLKLAKRFKQQVFVSCSVPFDPQLSLLVEKRLMDELKKILQENC